MKIDRVTDKKVWIFDDTRNSLLNSSEQIFSAREKSAFKKH